MTGLSKSTISGIAQEMDIDKENLKGRCPSKLSLVDQRRIIHQITSGKLDNAQSKSCLIQNSQDDLETAWFQSCNQGKKAFAQGST